jgi:hypothetical protein
MMAGGRRWRAMVPGALLWLLAAAPAGALAAAPAGELLPDILTLPPTDISMEIAENGHHLLRFTQTFANVGPGPLRIHGLPTAEANVMQGYQEIMDRAGNVARRRPVSSIIFHPHHQHWHADDFAAYELRQGAPWGPLVAKNGKISYCLVDDHQVDGYTGPSYPQTYLNCKTASQGINPGWADVYEADLYDQWIDVTEVQQDGVYYMVISADPRHNFVEADGGEWGNNVAWVRIELSGGMRQVRVMAPDEVLLTLGGKRVNLAVSPRLQDGRVLAHVRLAEQLGATVEWDGAHVILTKAAQRIVITPGESTARVGETQVEMGAPAVETEGRVLVPVRFLVERLGARVSYDWLTATVAIEP